MNLKGKHVFLSGPITGIDEEESRIAFEAAERYAKNHGAELVYNPRKDLDGKDFTHKQCMGWTLSELTMGDVEQVSSTNWANHYDVVLLLPGWMGSKGASVEAIVAQSIGIETVEL